MGVKRCPRSPAPPGSLPESHSRGSVLRPTTLPDVRALDGRVRDPRVPDLSCFRGGRPDSNRRRSHRQPVLTSGKHRPESLSPRPAIARQHLSSRRLALLAASSTAGCEVVLHRRKPDSLRRFTQSWATRQRPAIVSPSYVHSDPTTSDRMPTCRGRAPRSRSFRASPVGSRVPRRLRSIRPC
jgi:hypothetical protein